MVYFWTSRFHVEIVILSDLTGKTLLNHVADWTHSFVDGETTYLVHSDVEGEEWLLRPKCKAMCEPTTNPRKDDDLDYLFKLDNTIYVLKTILARARKIYRRFIKQVSPLGLVIIRVFLLEHKKEPEYKWDCFSGL